MRSERQADILQDTNHNKAVHHDPKPIADHDGGRAPRRSIDHPKHREDRVNRLGDQRLVIILVGIDIHLDDLGDRCNRADEPGDHHEFVESSESGLVQAALPSAACAEFRQS